MSTLSSEDMALHLAQIKRFEADMATLKERGVHDPTPLIKQLVEARGWSQAEFGRRLGMKPSQINHMMTGRRAWTVRPLALASEILSVPICYFFGETGDFEGLPEDLKDLLGIATPKDLELVAEMLRRLQNRN